MTTHGKLYDLIATTPIIAWTLICVRHQVPSLAQSVAAAELGSADALVLARAASKAAALLFVGLLLVLLPIRCIPRGKAQGLVPRIIAIGGTYLGLAITLLPEREVGWGGHLVSAVLILAGTLFAFAALWRLGRSISVMPEARRLITDGPYAVIRHPLYVGEAVTLVGLAVQYASLAALLLVALQLAFQFQRMGHEERVLARAFPEYDVYRARTARLIPGIY